MADASPSSYPKPSPVETSTAGRAPASRRRLDPDRLAAMEEERDFLLRSLDDLDAEHEAGDLDDDDYRELRDDYTVRAAAVIRAIDEHRDALAEARARRSGSRTRRLAWIVGVAAAAVLAGVLLAQAAGERGVGDSLTGSIDESLRDRVLECQQLGQGGADGLEASLQCFDDVLDQDPNNVEALTYRGWYVGLVAASARDQGLVDQADQLYEVAEAFVQQAIDIDPTYPDARAFRAVIADRRGDPERACSELAALAGLDAPPMMSQLTASIDERLSCP